MTAFAASIGWGSLTVAVTDGGDAAAGVCVSAAVGLTGGGGVAPITAGAVTVGGDGAATVVAGGGDVEAGGVAAGGVADGDVAAGGVSVVEGPGAATGCVETAGSA